ncbi:unnamed protein product [Sphagnum balticum]
MAGDDLVELKFRLYDGTDIGPNKYAPASTVATLKESILSQWPQDKQPSDDPREIGAIARFSRALWGLLFTETTSEGCASIHDKY